jgi:hypothetical protein
LNVINAQEASNEPNRTKGGLKQTLSDDHLIILTSHSNDTGTWSSVAPSREVAVSSLPRMLNANKQGLSVITPG